MLSGKRIALLCYPMIFQFRGGVANKIDSTLAALRAKGVDARLFDSNHDLIKNFDLVHLFCTGSGNHRVVEAANDLGVPVVLSSVFSLPYSRYEGRRDRWLHRIVMRLSDYSLNTTWGQVNRALRGAERIIVLGPGEAKALCENFDVEAARLRTIPNGVGEGFFAADANTFAAGWPGKRPVVLMAAKISPDKNQLAAAQAVSTLDADLVLFGSLGTTQANYFQACQAAAPGKVHHLGTRPLSDPFYAAAFAAAAVTVLPSRTEVTPNAILESLAAGTPAVCTVHNGWDRSFPAACYREVAPDDVASLRRHIAEFIAQPPDPNLCRAAVTELRWATVADAVIGVYEEALGLRAKTAPART
jgi:glycosyltransferase involved in cell wall biosynthesis